MALYSYRALDPRGRSQRGTLNAASLNEAKALLRERHVFPTEVRPQQPFRLNLPGWRRTPRLRPAQLAAFTRQFATLLQATIPYDQALGMILQQTRDLKFKAALSDIRGRVVEGTYLAEAMAAYPHYFPHMVTSMVRSGERSGTLVLIMSRLADYYDNLSRLRNRVTSALVYPSFMVVFGLAMVIFIVTYIIPRITGLLENFGAELPLSTRVLIALSDGLTHYWWAILILAGGSALWGFRFLRTPRGAELRDRLELRLPAWRTVRQKLILQRFSQTLATLLESGVELKAALGIAADVMENRVYQRAMRGVIEDVQSKGLPFAVAVHRTGLFPEDVTQMIAIGEETASLAPMLSNVANRLSQEVTSTMEAATAMLEPLMILAMGLVIGFIVVSVLLPMLQMNQLLSR